MEELIEGSNEYNVEQQRIEECILSIIAKIKNIGIEHVCKILRYKH